jgi:Protein of unknown function (DUF3738)
MQHRDGSRVRPRVLSCLLQHELVGSSVNSLAKGDFGVKRLFGRIYILLLLSAVVVFTIRSLSLGAQTTNPPTTPSNANLSPSLREFEVATIKPSNMNGTGLMGLYVYPGGRVLCGYCPVESLVELAFDMQSYQIKGLPGWAKDIAYDVNAKIPESSSPRPYRHIHFAAWFLSAEVEVCRQAVMN